MQKYSSIIILSGLLFGSAQAVAQGPGACGVYVDKTISLDEARKILNQDMLRADSGPTPERRIKILTTGAREDATADMDPGDIRIDTADPSQVMPITYPNGVTKYRTNFSGMRYLETDRPEDVFHRNVGKVKRSRGFYPDGTEMVGPYHTASWPWDVVIYKNDQGELIAFGGVMHQPVQGGAPNVGEHNMSRSRWWGEVRHVEVAHGEYEEHIIWRAPLHDFNQERNSTWVYHGYGGTLKTEFNEKSGVHEPVKNANGNYEMFYERVIEDDRGRPWVTAMFKREIDPSMKKAVGPEIQVATMKNPKTGEFFKAAKRGFGNDIEGYLREGGNVYVDKDLNLELEASSANDYVGRYGIYLDYRKADSADPTFSPVVDKNGELVDFAATMRLRQIMNATWLGRPQLERSKRAQLVLSEDGKLWMKFHFVAIDKLPPGTPIEGWPLTHEAFVAIGRTTAIAPVKIIYDSRGQPGLALDIDPRFEHMYLPFGYRRP